jgi:hypothetical protein
MTAQHGLEVVECTTCRRLFKDHDRTHVCPLGHENAWVDEEDNTATNSVNDTLTPSSADDGDQTGGPA